MLGAHRLRFAVVYRHPVVQCGITPIVLAAENRCDTSQGFTVFMGSANDDNALGVIGYVDCELLVVVRRCNLETKVSTITIGSLVTTRVRGK